MNLEFLQQRPWTKPLRIAAAMSLVCAGTAAWGAKDIVFNHISGGLTEMDRVAHDLFGSAYDVRDVDDRKRDYIYPRMLVGPRPSESVYANGKCVEGRVLVMFIIRTDGSVASPKVVRSASAALSNVALGRAELRSFEPAKVDGVAAATIAATEMSFSCEK